MQLGDGLKLAGSLAGVLGLSIEQTAAAMGVLSNAGLQATIAGTGLRQIFADLTRLSGPAEEALAELGLTASDVAINQTQDLISAIETLTRAGATTADIFAIFDVRAATAFVVLQRYVESFRELEASNIAASGVVASTSANIIELGDALQLAGAFAREVEIDIEQAAAAFGILERAGIGATQANVGLSRLFTELTQLSGPAQEALRAVGLSAADVSIINSDLVTVLERLVRSGVDLGTVFSTQSAEIFRALLGIGAPLKALEEANIAASGAVASTSANIIELGDALQLAGAFARGVEIDIEQAAAAFGILERAGIGATQANVGLSRLFTELTQLSGPAQEALRAVGLSAADVSIINSDLVTVLERLVRSGVDFGTVFSTQSAEIFRALQGSIGALKALEEANIAASGAVASTSANIQGNIGALKALEAANRNAAGAAAGLARIQDDTLIGAFKRADSAFRGFFIRLDSLTGASTAAKNAFDSIAQTINGFTDNLVRNLPRIEFAVRTLFLALLSSRVLLPVAQAVRALTLQFGYLRTAVLGVTVATRALLRVTGFLLLIESVTFLIDLFGILQRRLEGIGESIGVGIRVGVVRAIVGINEAIHTLLLFTDSQINALFEAIKSLGDGLTASFPDFSDFFDTTFSNLGNISANSLLTSFVEFIATRGGALTTALTNAFLGRGVDFSEVFDFEIPEFNLFEGFEIPDLSFRDPVEVFTSFVDDVDALAARLDDSINFTLYDDLLESFGLTQDQVNRVSDETYEGFREAWNNFIARWQNLIEGVPIPEIPPPPDIPTPEVPAPEVFDRITNEVVRLTDAGRDLNRTFESFFENVLTGAESLSDAFQQLIADLRRVLLRYLVIRPLLGSILSTERFPGLFEALPGRQFGGLARGLTIVGEGGPELVDFRTQGRVYSAGGYGGAARG